MSAARQEKPKLGCHAGLNFAAKPQGPQLRYALEVAIFG